MKYLLSAAAMLVATACADSTSPLRPPAGAHDVDQNATYPSATETQNPCNGDFLALTGTTHILIHSTTASSGNQTFYSDLSSNWDGTGVPSGVSYQGSEDDLTSFTTQDPFPIIYDQYQTIHMVSQGNIANFDQTIHFKITINANGQPTAEIDNAGAKCSG